MASLRVEQTPPAAQHAEISLLNLTPCEVYNALSVELGADSNRLIECNTKVCTRPTGSKGDVTPLEYIGTSRNNELLKKSTHDVRMYYDIISYDDMYVIVHMKSHDV